MPSLNEITIRIRADSSGLQATLSKAGIVIKEFSKTTGTAGTVAAGGLDKTTKSAGGLFGAIKGNIGHLAAMGLGFAAFYRGLVLVNAGIDSVIGGFVNFDANMRNVQSLSKQTDASLEEMSQSVLDLVSSGESMGKSAVDLSDALYDIVSSGFSGAAALELVKVAAQGAAAGLTTTKVSAKVLVGVLNAYKRPVTEAKDVMDSLFRIVDLGILTFNDLASGLGLVTASAASTGMSLDELGAGIVVLTRAGQTPSRVMTNLNAVLTAFLKPGKQARDIAKSLGIDLSVAAIESKGFPAVLQDIADKAGNNEEALARMFGNVRAIRAILPLAADGGREYASVLKQMGVAHEGAGAAARALAEQQKSLMFQINVLGSRIQAYLIRGLRPLTIWLAQVLPRAASVAGAAIGGFLGGLGALLQVARMIVRALPVLAPILAVLSLNMINAAAAVRILIAALTSTMGTIGLVIGAITALGFALSWLKGRHHEAKKTTAETALVQESLRQAALQSGSAVASLAVEADNTSESLGDMGAATRESLIEPLGQVPKLADEARYTLEKLVSKYSDLAQAAQDVDEAEGALATLYRSLKAINEAIDAKNLALIQETTAAVGGSPIAYEEAAAAVDQLSESEKALAAEVDDARRAFGPLDDEMEKQRKTLAEYEEQARDADDALSKLEQHITDLANAPIAGEARFRRAKFEIDQQIAAIEYQLEQLGASRAPDIVKQRLSLQRTLSDLRKERDRIEYEETRTIEPVRFNLEEMARSIEQEQPGTALQAEMKKAVAGYDSVEEAADKANDKLETQQDLVADLTPVWQAAKDHLDDLSSALDIIATALDAFRSGLQQAAQFAVDQFNRMQEAAEGASAAAGEALAAPPIPVAPTLATLFTLPAAEEQLKRLQRGAPGLTTAFADTLRGLVVKGYQEARETLPEAEPADLAKMIFDDTVAQAEAYFGENWPQYAEVFNKLLRDALSGVAEAPIMGQTTRQWGEAILTEFDTAVQRGVDEQFPGTTTYLYDQWIRYMLQASPSFLTRLDTIARDAISHGFTKDQVRQALSSMGIPSAIVEFIVGEYDRQKETLRPNLEKLGALLMSQSMGKLDEQFETVLREKGVSTFAGGVDQLLALVRNDPTLAARLMEIGSFMSGLIARGMDQESALKYIEWLEIWKKRLAAIPFTAGLVPQITAYEQAVGMGKQHGARNFLGGIGMVGEGGREMAVFPPRTSIASASDTARIVDFLKRSAAPGRQGAVFAPQFDIHAIGDSWEQMKMRVLSMVAEYLDRAAAEAGMNSPLIVRGVGQPRV